MGSLIGQVETGQQIASLEGHSAGALVCAQVLGWFWAAFREGSGGFQGVAGLLGFHRVFS